MRDVGETLMIFATGGVGTLLGAAVLAAVLAASRPQWPLFQTVVGGALIICALAVCAACSTGSDSTSGGLTVTREDGSIVEFEGSVRAWCGPPRDGGGTALQLGSGVPVGQSRPGGTRETERPRTYWLSATSRPATKPLRRTSEARARSLSAAGAAIAVTRSRLRSRRLSGASSATARSFAPPAR